jgi:hypothetical protein
VTVSQLRRDSYRLARALGDVQAAKRGPASYSKRVVRRNVYRVVNKNLAKSLRGFGL